MGKIARILVAACLLGSLHTSAGNFRKNDSIYCLQVEGKIANAGEASTDCRIELFVDNVLVDSVILHGGKKKFKFNFKRNLHYTLRLSKPGYASKSICINTRIAPDFQQLYEFVFETELEPLKEPSDATFSDKPVARIYFDQRKECFYYSKDTGACAKRDVASAAH
jgi:hypothetical protein